MNKDLEVREVSLEILKKVLYENEQGHRLIKAVLDKNNDWESARKAFLKKLTLGVLERKEELEYVLSLFYQKNAKRMNLCSLCSLCCLIFFSFSLDLSLLSNFNLLSPQKYLAARLNY